MIALACMIGALIALIALVGLRSRPEDLGQHPDGLSPEKLKQTPAHTRRNIIRTYRSAINRKLKEAFKTRSMWLMLISLSIAYFLWQLILTQSPAHLPDRGFSPSDPVLFLQPALIYGLILGCSILGRLSISVLGERIEARYIMMVAGILLLAGIGFGATYVSSPLIAGNYFGAESYPLISRVPHPVTCIFQYLSPTIAGMIFDINHSYLPAVIIAGIGGMIGTVFIFACKPPVPEKAT